MNSSTGPRLIAVLLAILCVTMNSQRNQGAWLTGYDHRQEIVVLPSMTGADLTDYPLLVKIADQNNSLFSTANSAAGLDIVFTKADGTSKLNREIEYYSNSGTKELDAWVKTDVSSSQLTRLYMYYKGADEANSTATWDSNYKMVQHLNETSGNHSDSTLNGNTGTVYGATMNAAGPVDGADSFDGVNDYVGFTNHASTNISSAVSIEAWVRPESGSANGFGTVVGRDNTCVDGYWLGWRESDKNVYFYLEGVKNWYSSTPSMTQDTWQHVVATYDEDAGADNMRVYLNGVPTTRTETGAIGASGTALDIGKSGGYHGKGTFDEIRISDVARTPEEIEASFNNQNDTAAYQVASSQQTQGGFLEDYKYRQAITIKAGATAADLADFPALVHIKDASNGVFANAASANGYDVVFTAADGLTKLNHDLESFNTAGGSEELAAWVKTPLSKDHDTVVYMYYGGPDLGDPSSSATWDGGFRMVQHLQENPGGGGPQIIDSTSYGNDGTVAGAAAGLQQVDGHIGGALDFDGSNVWVNFGNDASLRPAEITIEAWASAEALNSWNGIITSKSSTAVGTNLHMGTVHDISTMPGDGSGYTYMDTGWAPSLDTWYHIVATFDGDKSRLYVNGVLEATDDRDLGYGTATPDTILGRFYTFYASGLEFNGLIDEVRISDTARDLDWILAQYRLMSDQVAYLEFGDELLLPEPNSLVLLALGGLALLGYRRRKR